LNLLSNGEEKISKIVEKLKKYSKISETNFKVENKKEILEKIEKKYFSFAGAKILKID
jgi:hypothetical protein